MSEKSIVWISVFVFSFIGGYIPVFFGNSLFSMWSIVANAVGGIIGIWIGFKIARLIKN